MHSRLTPLTRSVLQDPDFFCRTPYLQHLRPGHAAGARTALSRLTDDTDQHSAQRLAQPPSHGRKTQQDKARSRRGFIHAPTPTHHALVLAASRPRGRGDIRRRLRPRVRRGRRGWREWRSLLRQHDLGHLARPTPSRTALAPPRGAHDGGRWLLTRVALTTARVGGGQPCARQRASGLHMLRHDVAGGALAVLHEHREVLFRDEIDDALAVSAERRRSRRKPFGSRRKPSEAVGSRRKQSEAVRKPFGSHPQPS